MARFLFAGRKSILRPLSFWDNLATMTKDSDIQSLLNRAGNNLPAIDQIAAYLLQKAHPLRQVLEAYQRYLAGKPGSANAAFNYAYYLSKDGQFEAAIDMYMRSLRSGIEAPEEVHLNIANIYMDHLKNSNKARSHLQKSLSLKPDYANAYFNLGNLSEQNGDRKEAIKCFEQCLKFNPANENALARLADAHRFIDENDPLLEKLIAIAENSDNANMHFALGRAYEQLASFDQAWLHFSRANELDKPGLPSYRPAHTEVVFQRIISQCNSQWLAPFKGESEDTVFICGVFRTGSTLLEQLLAAHPGFVAGGESQFFPRLVAREFRDFPEGLDKLTIEKALSWRQQHGGLLKRLFGEGIRTTDKRPDNFLHIGLIKAVLPSAKFVLTQRDWRDVATSVFTTRLGRGQNYATSLENIRHYVDLQTQLVDHWASLLDNDLVRVRYEDLVTEPRNTLTGLLEGLGEPWDENCLSFNKLKNTVQTASVWQVREPLHTNSIGRWKHYQAYFDSAFGVC
jgi:Flp pilus assembly protein TadD